MNIVGKLGNKTVIIGTQNIVNNKNVILTKETYKSIMTGTLNSSLNIKKQEIKEAKEQTTTIKKETKVSNVNEKSSKKVLTAQELGIEKEDK